MARIRRERPVLLTAILSALIGLAAGMNKCGVLVLLLVMIFTALFNEAPVTKAAPVEPVEIEPAVLPEPISPRSPPRLRRRSTSRSWCSRRRCLDPLPEPAAEKAFGDNPAGAHMSARVRSPGVLDMVRETIATGKANQIEHSERLAVRGGLYRSSRPGRIRIKTGGMSGSISCPSAIFQQARRIDRMRSDFVANASHELRTPLASLRGFIETLQGPARNDPKAQEKFLGIMHDQATRMSRLVDDLLSLSRLELKSHIAPDEAIDLAPLLGHVRDALAPLAEDVGVEISLDRAG